MDRKLAPAFHKRADYDLPRPERLNLGLGKPSLIYLPYSQTPVAKFEFVFEAGRLYEQAPGLAQFTVNLLDKGTTTKNAQELANLFDYYGAHLDLSCDSDFAYISLYCLSQHTHTLLPLVFSILKEPTFPEDEFKKYRQIFIENLKVNQGKNSFLASIALKKALFNQHPYGRSIEIDDAKLIDRHHLTGFFQENFNLLNVFVTGSVNNGDLSMLTKFCQEFDLSGRSSRLSPIKPTSLQQLTIEGPRKDQASIRFGKTTLTRKSDHIASLTLVNHLLGGFFGSRLMKNIREERGLTYGIYSSLNHFKHASIFSIGAEVNAENAEEARHEILREVSALEAISEEEMTIAKSHLLGSIQNDNASIFNIAERIKTAELFQLEADFYWTLCRDIEECKVPALIDTAKQEINPAMLWSIVVR